MNEETKTGGFTKGLSTDEIEILKLFRRLPAKERAAVLEWAESRRRRRE